MLRNKYFVVICSVTVTTLGLIVAQWLSMSHKLADAFVDLEHDRYCQGLENLILVSQYSDRPAKEIGRLYASGICVQQNFGEADRWFRKAEITEKANLGREYFYAAGVLASTVDQDSPLETRVRIINAVRRSLELGFAPTESDQKRFPDSSEYLMGTQTK